VPGKTKAAERRIEAAIAALSAVLTKSGAPWMVIGGIAVIARGVRRMTTDVDAVVRGDAISIDALLELSSRQAIKPRIADAAAFARANLVLLLEHAPSGVELDVSFGWTAFEHEALAARSVAAFGRVRAPMATPEDLVIMKAMAARPTDVADAVELLGLYPAIDLTRVRRRLRELAELADAPELASGLAAILRLVPPKRRTPKRAPRRKR
jgi:hypothetical protein